jgi:large subunit ribosomal protein L4
MLEVPIYNVDGQKIDTLQVDEKTFGGEVNIPLLKQAIVSYHANLRLGTAATKNRSKVEGSTKKLFKQKGTGNARRGPIRSNLMKGGGVAFAKVPRDFRKAFPKNMRKAALNSAILAKLQGSDLMVVDGLSADAPKTKKIISLLENLKINRRVLLTLAERDRNLYLSARNIADVTVRTATELSAWDVATRPKMLVTTAAMKALIATRQEAAK